MVVRGWRLPPTRVRRHHDQVVQEHPPGVQAHAEAVDARLLEGVLVEQPKELQHGEQRVELHTLQVRGHKPVKEVTALC